MENRVGTSGISQPFYTQICRNFSPQKTHEPLSETQPRIIPTQPLKDDICRAEELLSVLAKGIDKLSSSSMANSTSSVTTPRFLAAEYARIPPKSRRDLDGDKYLFRYLTKVPVDQQRLLDAPSAWQPSKSERRIRGNVPTEVYGDAVMRSDRAAEEVQVGKCHDKTGSQSNVVHQLAEQGSCREEIEDLEADGSIENDKTFPLASQKPKPDSQNSPSASPIDWPPTPKEPLREPKMPLNSSPLKAPASPQDSIADTINMEKSSSVYMKVHARLGRPSDVASQSSNVSFPETPMSKGSPAGKQLSSSPVPANYPRPATDSGSVTSASPTQSSASQTWSRAKSRTDIQACSPPHLRSPDLTARTQQPREILNKPMLRIGSSDRDDGKRKRPDKKDRSVRHSSQSGNDRYVAGSGDMAEKKRKISPFRSLKDFKESPVTRASCDLARDSRRSFMSSLGKADRQVSKSPLSEVDSTTDSAEQGLYQSYSSAYPDYGGSIDQFRQAFEEVLRTADGGKRLLHQSLWDDFVFRKIHDFPSYVIQAIELGRDILSYPDYYAEMVDDVTLRCRRILTRSSLMALDSQSMNISAATSVNSSAVRREIFSDVHHPMSTRSTSQISNEHKVLVSNEQVQEQSQAAEEQPDQDVIGEWVASQTSNRAHGAQSPELGSADEDSDSDVYSTARDTPGLDEPGKLEKPNARATATDNAAEVTERVKSLFQSFAGEFTSLESEKALRQGRARGRPQKGVSSRKAGDD